MVKIHVVSDFHLEFVGLDLIHEQPECDIVVVAGDVFPGPEGIHWLGHTFNKPVVYIAGNHEYYRPDLDMEVVHALIQDAEKEYPHVNFLQNETITIQGIRFICATLWTDFNLYGNPQLAEEIAVEGMCDFEQVTWGGGIPLNVEKVKDEFYTSYGYMMEELQNPFNGKTVVVTHHLPSAMSIAPQYFNSSLNPCFGSNLNKFIKRFQPNLWIHGHTHSNVDYWIDNTRVICNPYGYRNRVDRNNGKRENWDFIPDLVIDV